MRCEEAIVVQYDSRLPSNELQAVSNEQSSADTETHNSNYP